MIKKIFLVTKITTKNFFEPFNILDKKNKKINNKSIYFWMIVIIIITTTIISNKVIEELVRINQQEIFLNIYISIITIIMFFQSILLCSSVYYFSKDIESFLPMPIKPIELFMGKFNTIMSILYGTEIIALLIPLILYGTATIATGTYYINLILFLFLFPILPALIVSILTNVFMIFNKYIRNKELFQLIITLLIIGIIVVGEYLFLKTNILNQENMAETMVSINSIAEKINDSLVVIKPLISFLLSSNPLKNISFVLGIYAILFIVLIVQVNKSYLKKLLQSTKKFTKNKKLEKKLDDICKVNNLSKAYIVNEFRNINRNMNFFIQGIFPVISIIFMICMLTLTFKINMVDKQSEIKDFLMNLNLNIEGVCIILGICQIIYSFISLSITSTSRQGRNAIFMKYIPVDVYTQILLKNVPQVVVGMIVSIVILILTKLIFNTIPIIHLLIIFIIANIINILNSYIMVIVDIKRPILNWKSETEVMRQNGNKLFQYILTIIIVLALMYIVKVFKNINIFFSEIILFLIFSVFIFLIDLYVRKQLKNNRLLIKIK